MRILLGLICLVTIVTIYCCLVMASKSDEEMGIK